MEFNESWLFSSLIKYKAVYRSTWASLVGGKEFQCMGSMFNLWVRRSPGEGNVNPLQYSCLGNPMNRGAWWVTVHRVSKSQTRLKWLSTAHTFFLTFFSIMVYYRIFSSLCYTVGSCCLSILICIWWSQIPSPSLGNNKSALSVSLFCREVHLCDILDSTYK